MIKHAHHITADIEGPEPSQEEETAPPVHCFYVGRPLQFIIQQHPQVFAGLNRLYLPSISDLHMQKSHQRRTNRLLDCCK